MKSATFFIIAFLIFCFSQFNLPAKASQFGEYNVNKYALINYQLQNQRANALRRQARYQRNTAVNIRYPSINNPYPNIERRNNYMVSKAQRYSPRYYERFVK